MRSTRSGAKIAAILTITLFITVAYVSCIKDMCTGIVCQNSGVCVEGRCACALGYYGPACATAWNARFTGTWQVTDTIIKTKGSLNSYSITISNRDSSMPYTFVIDNFADLADSVAGIRASHIDFKLNDKKVDSVITINTGSGKIDTLTNTITAYYTIKYGDSGVNHFIRCSR